jgi:hypothetical protein
MISQESHNLTKDLELMREAMKGLGQATHLTEHNKANCARCREAHKRIRTAITKLEERLLSE